LTAEISRDGLFRGAKDMLLRRFNRRFLFDPGTFAASENATGDTTKHTSNIAVRKKKFDY